MATDSKTPMTGIRMKPAPIAYTKQQNNQEVHVVWTRYEYDTIKNV